MNALVTTNIQLPAHLAGRVGAPSAIAGAMTSGIGAPSFKKIGIRGSRFRIKEGPNETVLPGHTLRAVIVGASSNITKLFYKGAYDPNDNDKGPDCYSNDGVRPANDSPDIQSQLCATCEQNQWGSKQSETGTKMKACADQKRLAIIAANDDSPEPDVYLFTVTPSALADFRNYGKLLESKGFPPEICVTELSFDDKASFPKIQFKFGGFVDEHMIPTIDSLVTSQTVREIIGESSPATATSAPPPAPKPSPVKKKEAAPVVQELTDDDVEIIPAPTKTKGFGAAEPSPKAAPPAPKSPPVVQSSKLTAELQSIIDGMDGDDDE